SRGARSGRVRRPLPRCFFFQAEDGIRVFHVTGVQTCALPISGFGLLGHLLEMAEGSGLSAELVFEQVPRLPSVDYYLARECVPGGTHRNFDSYGQRAAPLSEAQRLLLCDPQTSGGLLVAVAPEGEDEFLAVAAELGLSLSPIGELTERRQYAVQVV